MSALGVPLVAAAVHLALALVLLGLVLAGLRLLAGPSAADRIVAVDYVTVLLVAVAGLLALLLDEPEILDLALVLALVGFLATVAFARYVERRAAGRAADEDPGAEAGP
jgi:multicomponent Na+:H+ antiporter subunit F